MPTVETIRAMVEQARFAPSSHNTQPWLFRCDGDNIDVWADRTRALPVNDPLDRELTISCGAALMSLRVAAAAAGLATSVRLLPDSAHADWLARLAFTGGAADPELAPLAEALTRRQTYRKKFAARALAQHTLHSIDAAVAAEACALLTLDHAHRSSAATLVAEGDRLQWGDSRWRRELATWMHARRWGDGLTLPTLAAPIARALVRTFDMGRSVAARNQQLASASPWLTVLASDRDDATAWLRAGQALQRALLTGCRLGVQASYLNQPIEVATLRPRLQALTASAMHPQLLIRWGHPTDTLPATPRRPIDTLVDGAVFRHPPTERIKK